jgi:hypothetical protein
MFQPSVYKYGDISFSLSLQTSIKKLQAINKTDKLSLRNKVS